MHPTHDWFTGHLARERVGVATQRAATRRLRSAAGADRHSSVVAAFSAVADRLRADDPARRDLASAAPSGPGSTTDDLARAA